VKKYALILAVAATLLVAACSGSTAPNAITSDRKASAADLQQLQKADPTPRFIASQVRKNLVELETAQARTTQTTTFFFNQGVQAPIQSCPSIGFPIPATAQLTNPQQILENPDNNDTAVIPQVDPVGIYTGDSTGTYIICINAQGQAYADYWEGFVQTVTGPAKWNDATKQIELVGAPSFKFSKGH
jgi:hypothetical protein